MKTSIYDLEDHLLQLINVNNDLQGTIPIMKKIVERINEEMDLKFLKNNVMIMTQTQVMAEVRLV